MYILALNASHDDNGNTAYLLNKILSYCQGQGAETELVSVHAAIADAKTPFCTACSTPCSKACYKGTKLEELFEKTKKADFIIFGSPVYFGSMTAQLKALFDKTRAIRAEKAWLGKPVAAVTVGASKYGGQERTLEAIHSCALVEGMTLLGNSNADGMGHFGVSAQKPAKEDDYAKNCCKMLANRIMEFLNV
ncbi:MAG: flavodoxin family protein [Clostridia bacterium]|nr:flavodoxin family protein [Clostridia bacterium]